jgi:methylenetetrahydrofolate reductase (NADPH)
MSNEPSNTDSPATSASNDSPHVGEAAERLARRPWPATPLRGLEVSFEFFPTATPEAADRLDACAAELAPLTPTFASVTYGAGGTSQDRTINTLKRLQDSTSLPLAGHLTTVSASKDDTLAMVDTYLNLGVRHIVALRGDEPADGTGPHADGFETAAELVAGIRNQTADGGNGNDVEISVAAYPEVHPKASSANDDMDRLKEKIDAGADRAITQFFYDNESFLRFQDRARAAGISVPIVAGIMPIGSFARVSSFAKRCGTKIPAWMPDLFDGLEDAPDVHQLVSATVAAEQCRGLAEHGVRHFHFYTMNKPELTAATCRILGIQPAQEPAQQPGQSGDQASLALGA